MIFTSLASGSSGNCTFAGTDQTHILIDCGISAKRIAESLTALGTSVKALDAVFLTHEHNDHIKGLKRLMSAFGIPVYASQGTLSALADAARDTYFSFAGKELMHVINADVPVKLGDFCILPFRTSHDAAGPLAYRIEADQSAAAEKDKGLRPHVSACVMTDTGYFDNAMRDHMQNLDVLLLEANHDRGMLSNGPYPMRLKRRIMSREGHLSNHAAGQLLAEIINPKLTHVFLGHLSKENNTPELAMHTVREEVAEKLGEDIAKRLSISVALHDGISQVICL